MDQQIYNIALGLVAFLGGWWMKVMWEALKDLQRTDHEINRKVSEIEWEYATTVERGSPLVQSLAAGLGLTEQQLDDLFTLAATL